MRAFCSAVPNTTTGIGPKMFICTADAPVMPAPDCAMACIITAASATPSPAPPTASGMQMPSQPSSAIARWKSCGKRALRSASSQ
jgi:hypothetical protein